MCWRLPCCCSLPSGIALPGFLDTANLISIVRSVSVLGLLAVGMAIVIIGRGIDLAVGGDHGDVGGVVSADAE